MSGYVLSNAEKLTKPDAARHCTTIGEIEKMAGLGSSHDERFEFWKQFAHLKDDAFDAGRAELYRRIEAATQASDRTPPAVRRPVRSAAAKGGDSVRTEE